MNTNELLSSIVNVKVTSCEPGEIVKTIYYIEFENGTLFCIFSAWRLEHHNQVILAESDATEIEETKLLSLIQRIVGKKLLSFSISKQYDLVLNYEDSYCIKTFSNISYFQTENGGDWDANWRLGIPDQNIIGYATNKFEMAFDKFEHN